ncbi:MAG: hypothetical protein WC370_05225 [Dehalococcoidales bacterium]|jgi:hypothetical protein
MNALNIIPYLVGAVRFFVGLLAVIFLVVIYKNTMSNVDFAASAGASAIQIIQLYAEGMFKALAVTGGAVALYILSRFYQRNPNHL